MKKLTVEDLDLQGKRILMRVDFNVPLEEGKVANDKRIKAALPTIKYIADKGGKLVLMSHLGRPKGSRVPEMSLRPCVVVLSRLLGKDVAFVDDCIGETVETAVNGLNDGEVLLLENLRYYKEETDNDAAFLDPRQGDVKSLEDPFHREFRYSAINPRIRSSNSWESREGTLIS